MNREGRPETVEEIREMLQRTETLLRAVEFAASYTIDDYPIGGANRGKCELGYEWKKGKGYRTIRRTTDKRGTWCKPKSSTFQDAPIVVVHGPDLKHEAAWLRCEHWGRGMYLQWANGESEHLCNAPFCSEPNREERTVKWTTTTMALNRHGLSQEGVRESVDVIPADSPEMIALWDAYMEGFQPLLNDVQRVAMNCLFMSPVS